MFLFICGLTHTSVTKLTKTVDEAWKQLGRSARKRFDELVKLTSFSNNFREYRQVISKPKRPCIPFIGPFQKDWVYFKETSKNDGLIHRKNLSTCYELMGTIRKFQEDFYEIKEDENIQKILYNLPEVPEVPLLMQISSMKEVPASK